MVLRRRIAMCYRAMTVLILNAVANPVLLTQRPMAMRVHRDDTLGLGSIVQNHMTVCTVGRVPPLSSPVRLAAPVASDHCSGSDRMDRLGTAHVSLVLVNSPKSSKSQTVTATVLPEDPCDEG